MLTHHGRREGIPVPCLTIEEGCLAACCSTTYINYMFGKLTVHLDSVGSITTAAPEPAVKKMNIPPIVVSPKSLSNDLIRKLNLTIPKDVDFEYTRRGLKVRTNSSSDYKNTEEFLHKWKMEYFAFNPKPGNYVKCVLMGLPPSTECDELGAGLTEKWVRVFHVRHVKKITKLME
jgi:hypothetical protein